MGRETILVIDDEEDLLKLVLYNLEKYRYIVHSVTSGEEAFEKLKAITPDLILLDLMLPDIDGLEICRIVKNDTKTSGIPIIMLTAKGEEADIVTGLEMGADDYITKPFSPRVLLARIKAVLRRGQEREKLDVYTRHDIVLNISTHEVQVARKPIVLTATEFNILHMLMRKPGWVFTRNQIINAIKGDDYPVTDR